MKRLCRRLLAITLTLAMAASMVSLSAFAAGAKTDGIWNYTVDETGAATLVGARDDYKSLPVVLIPAQVGGAPVTRVGDGINAVLTNYRGSGYILVPREISAVADRAFYDCNPVTGWSIFSGTSTAAGSFNGCSGTHYGDGELTQTLAVSAGENGAILPSGTYGIPPTWLPQASPPTSPSPPTWAIRSPSSPWTGRRSPGPPVRTAIP